ncbi:MAG TPA: glutamine-hydrolyzing carbamoyl-phosphate synthase small subunit [Steroidobacteraceae bacterium]|jgi:carbamoyl-phosphate synthase small subunit|nr:glutamine-hydrolyzing carbamoyl-phosphate synthase small subunit [Steroidobacteraceae bacterium]
MTHLPAVLALADGSIFRGQSIGAPSNTTGEVVFNTALTGYQEILTDPSYARQIVTLTYPHIGNTGTNPEDLESSQIYAAGLVIRDLPLHPSSWRMVEPLSEFLTRGRIVAIAGIDTRRLTRLLREKGAQSGCIVTGEQVDEQAAVKLAGKFPGLKGMDLAKVVSTKRPFQWNEGNTWQDTGRQNIRAHQRLHVVAYDFGIKRNILRLLSDCGCRMTVVPAQTSAREVLQLQPDGVFLSNGPGDPEPCDYAITATRELLEAEIPLFGICLGHQLMGLAVGARTVKMKFGHHGANHPVQDLDSGRVMITSQNHGFAVDESTLPDKVKATHRSLFDGSLQGLAFKDRPAFSFQGHPEASPGPHDVKPLFERFNQLMLRRLQNQLRQSEQNPRR